MTRQSSAHQIVVGTTLNTNIKTGSRKGRRNYNVDFKKRLAIAACETGISVARLALDHGINANMLHKWRRAHLAGGVGITELPQPEFLAVTIARSGNTVAQCPVYAPSPPMDLPVPKLPAPKPGVIEIRVRAAILRLEGAVDAATLEQVLRHLHP
ncbi:MAG: transposase [Glaciimonas sp.]|nr:transposase [Glaciimonas sp.]